MHQAVILNTIIIIVFINLQNPLTIALTVASQSLLASYTLFKITSLSWFSYLFIIVFLRGIIVIFIYVSALASNQFVSPGLLKIFISTIIITLPIPTLNQINLIETFTNISNTLIQPSSDQMLTIYTTPGGLITTSLILILLLSLTVIIKISKNNKLPLRST